MKTTLMDELGKLTDREKQRLVLLVGHELALQI